MRIGLSLLNNWGIEDVQALVGLAERAEALGFDSVWTHDHVFNVGHVFDRIGGKPYYEPLTLLSFGVGVGAIENEMEAMGTPFKARGAFTDEAITVLRTLWNEEDPRFVGTYSRFAGMKFSPKPLQKPIPVVIGGVSR